MLFLEPVPFYCVQKYDLILNLARISASFCRNVLFTDHPARAMLAWLGQEASNHSPNLLYFLLSCVPLVASEQSSSASARRKKQRSIHPNQLPLYGKLLASFQYDQRSSELENDRDHHSLTLKVSRDTAWFFIITAQRAVRSNTMLKHLGGCRAAGGGQPPKSEGGRERA